jgi:hypothetical protein
MIVKGNLVPLLRHFQKVVATQLVSNNSGIAGNDGPEVMGEPKLLFGVPMRPDQFFHNLQENAGRISGERTASRVEHLIPQGSESGQPVIDTPHFKRFQEIDDGKGNSKPSGFCHLFNAVRMEVWVNQPSGAGPRIIPVEDVIDDAQ